MTTKTSGSLVNIATNESTAANDDRLAEDAFPGLLLRDDLTAGWSPYEVWRTRVKLARDSGNDTPLDSRRR